MRKKAGIVLCITGVVLGIIAIIMLLSPSVYQDDQANNNENITEIKDEERSDTTTENQEEAKQATSQEQVVSNTDSKQQSSTVQSAHEINPEVYEWPCGNERYQNCEEPRQVTEFAKYKEYYEQIAQQFLEYEGKDVRFIADEDGLYFDECINEGGVKVTYDRETLMNLLEKSRVESISVSNDYIIFRNTFDYNYIMYLYDETLTYNDPFPSDKDDWITDSIVNIAPIGGGRTWVMEHNRKQELYCVS